MYWFRVLLCWNTTVDLQGLWTISPRAPFHTTAYPGIQLWTYDACGQSPRALFHTTAYPEIQFCACDAGHSDRRHQSTSHNIQGYNCGSVILVDTEDKS